jgi:flavin reductase (DIM6/NTAB) family NADH-FMN oxidoreductase RutF
MSVDERSFRKTLSCFASGVTVVTTATAEGEYCGVTVSAFSSVSLEPPLILVCLNNATNHLDAYCDGKLVVHVLRETQQAHSIRFASRADDKFAGLDIVEWDGVPTLQNTLAQLRCTVHAVHDGGDHKIIVCRVDDLQYDNGGQPLLYFRGAYEKLHGSTI